MGVMGQNILYCIVWKNTKESEHLTQIPKPHLSTSLNMNKLKNILQKKVYVHKFYKENYPLSYKKTYGLFFFI